MKDFLGSDPILAVHLADPKGAKCQGDEETARLEFAAAGVSRERRVIRRAGAPISTLARGGWGGWAVAGAKRLRNNGLGVLMLESLLKVSSKRNQGTQVGGRLRGRVEPINGRKRVYGE
jgi:hypothetical protein